MEQPLAITDVNSDRAAHFAVTAWRGFTDHAGWDALAGDAAEPNPFAERWYLEAGLSAFDEADTVHLATLHDNGRLVGLLPIVRRLRYERYPFPNIANWLHANAFAGTPLVAAGQEHAFWRELFAWCDKEPGLALFLHIEALPADGPLYAALRDVCAVERRTAAVVHRIDRAMLASDLSPQDYFDASMSGKKRKELRRQHARLAEQGALVFERRRDDQGLAEWSASFLALERAGWKGAEGSALACEPAKAVFFNEALHGAARHNRLERLAITLDGAPIAMLANFVTAPGAFSFKTTYDERFARFSPGVLLQRENLDLLARDDIAWTDSCAAADHPMIERIWREKRTIVRVSVAIGGPLRRDVASAIFRAETRGKPQGL